MGKESWEKKAAHAANYFCPRVGGTFRSNVFSEDREGIEEFVNASAKSELAAAFASTSGSSQETPAQLGPKNALGGAQQERKVLQAESLRKNKRIFYVANGTLFGARILT